MPLNPSAPRAYELGDEGAQPVKAGAAIFVGYAVGLAAGFARHLVAGDVFAGFALDECAAPVADGDARVRTRDAGRVVLPIAGAVAADVGKLVYASGPLAFTFTEGGNSAVGRMVRLDAPGSAVVAFDTAIAGAYAPPAA